MIGQFVDIYKITEKLGQGGMGSVWKAVDTQLNRTVALKVMNVQDDMFVKRFRAEAQALARLDHPNIVKVFGMRETKMGLAIIMEFVEGKTWSDCSREGKFNDPSSTVEVTSQLLKALAYAHSKGIIHRDIKPSNIMITEDGTVKVTDFGLAKLVDPHATAIQNPLTQVGQAVGSLFYMSPEQVKGLDSVDHRTDLYSSGITMYEVLAGRPPFDKDVATSPYIIQKKIVDGEIEPVTTFASHVPMELAKIIGKATHVKPEKRFQSANDMLSALSGVSSFGTNEKEKTHIKKTSTTANIPKYATIAVAAVALLFGGFYVWQNFISPSAGGNDTMYPVTLTINPTDAQVMIDNEAVNISDLKLKAGDYQLSILKDGFTPIIRTLTVTDSPDQSYSFSLESALFAQNDTTNTLELNNNGAGNQSNGNEPPTPNNSTNNSTRTSNQNTNSSNTNNSSNSSNNSSNDNNSSSNNNNSSLTGTIVVNAIGSGSATVAGKSGSVQVPADQSQTVSCSANGLTTTQRVKVSAGETRNVSCFFEGEVAVNVRNSAGEAVMASIDVGGNTKFSNMVRRPNVSVGTYTINVSAAGYTPQSISVTLQPGVGSKPSVRRTITLQ